MVYACRKRCLINDKIFHGMHGDLMTLLLVLLTIKVLKFGLRYTLKVWSSTIFFLGLLSKKCKLLLLKNIHIGIVTCFEYKGVCGMAKNRTEAFISSVFL